MNVSTKLWFTSAKTSKRVLIADINVGSKWHGMKPVGNIGTEEGREATALQIAQGWDQCGPLGEGSWAVEHCPREPIVLSEMAQSMIRR